jgi:membrane-associated protease RseP (regulator of RpoE activity)
MPYKKYLIHIGLFIATLITTTLAGAEWTTGNLFLFSPKKPLGFSDFLNGFNYSIPFLLALTFHEFGHYFAAKYYQIKVSLPYYIPIWFSGLMSFGTMGAFIKLMDRPVSRKQFFDIGIAGPLAGFLVAILVLWYGFTHLPPVDYIYTIHPEYKVMGANFAEKAYKNLEGQIYIGNNIIFWFFKNYVANPTLMPNSFELMHYPMLLSGYLALFFTALNLIPIGQLDGGHILYGLIGKKNHSVISPVLLVVFAFYSGLGIFKISDFQFLHFSEYLQKILPLLIYIYFLKICFSKIQEESNLDWILALGITITQLICSFIFPNILGYSGFLPFIFLLGRFLGVYHPDVEQDEPLDFKRKVLGWLSLIIFILCFSPAPFIVY